mmetsp:Transcript_534/g.806  ORF Transcript_534/g.806 Transcript_534/m.806 type:complete len:91 (-) Transcript_534:979-1251(-)
MPELPEVENFRRLLLPLVSTKSTLSLECTSKTSPPKKFITPEELNELNENCLLCRKRRAERETALHGIEVHQKDSKSNMCLFVHTHGHDR